MQAHWSALGIAASSQPTVYVLPIAGGANRPGPDIATAENTLDVETVGACFPSASLTNLLFLAPNTFAGFLAALQAATRPTTVAGRIYTPVCVSVSWGAPEVSFGFSVVARFEATLARAYAAGVTVTSASGDGGANDGTAVVMTDYPASSQYVVACGGTKLSCPSGAYAGAGTSEVAWTSGGGGISKLVPRPAWQASLAVAAGGRCVPDVALNADPNTGVYFTLSPFTQPLNVVYGGTSVVAPAMAATSCSVHPGGIGELS